MTSLELALKSILPLLEPMALQEFENVLIPELQKIASGVGSPDVKVILSALIAALNTIGQTEIPKV